MKKLKKLNRRQKKVLIDNGYDFMKYLIERQDHNSFTFVHRETKEIVKLNYK